MLGVIISTNFVGAHSKNKDSREERTLLIEIIIVGHFFGIYVFKKKKYFLEPTPPPNLTKIKTRRRGLGCQRGSGLYVGINIPAN